MKLSMDKIVMAMNSLERMNGSGTDVKFPAILALKFARVVKDLDPFFKDFMDQRQKLIQKYGEVDKEDPTRVLVAPEKAVEFNTEFNALLQLEIEFVPSVSFTEDDFAPVEINISDAMALLPFFKE